MYYCIAGIQKSRLEKNEFVLITLTWNIPNKNNLTFGEQHFVFLDINISWVCLPSCRNISLSVYLYLSYIIVMAPILLGKGSPILVWPHFNSFLSDSVYKQQDFISLYLVSQNQGPKLGFQKRRERERERESCLL